MFSEDIQSVFETLKVERRLVLCSQSIATTTDLVFPLYLHSHLTTSWRSFYPSVVEIDIELNFVSKLSKLTLAFQKANTTDIYYVGSIDTHWRSDFGVFEGLDVKIPCGAQGGSHYLNVSSLWVFF